MYKYYPLKITLLDRGSSHPKGCDVYLTQGSQSRRYRAIISQESKPLKEEGYRFLGGKEKRDKQGIREEKGYVKEIAFV
jgi:hypothetical protein